MSHHRAHTYHSLETFLQDCAGKSDGSDAYQRRVRKWTAVWNKHIERNGNVPFVMKCAVCSGLERKKAIKAGAFKVSSRPQKRLLREEMNETQLEEPNWDEWYEDEDDYDYVFEHESVMDLLREMDKDEWEEDFVLSKAGRIERLCADGFEE